MTVTSNSNENVNFTEIEKQTLHYLVRQELSRLAEQIARNEMTLARLNDIYNIEKEEDDKKEQTEQYAHNIKELNTIIEIFKEEFDLMDGLEKKLS